VGRALRLLARRRLHFWQLGVATGGFA